ncbi:MAG TPA: YcnI family protein [Lacisediminihabitans sp.]|uniref:YcnI family copper-binding membrane protein n=1 Tax=Lacisediminihabitans sp. TaxID=2787631 RepID=UPI002ED81FC6
MTRHIVLKTSITIGAGALLALTLPLAASAHVTITPNTAPAGSYSLITFKVPTESATATTTRLEVDIPAATPFSSVSYVPVAGWTTQLVTERLPKPVPVAGNELTEAVTKVIWTAQPGFDIKQGQLQLFPLSVGSVPKTGRIVLSALQTYSDGSVVSWTQTGSGAEHPAPVLYVDDAPPVAASASTPGPTVSAEPVAAATTGSSDTLARGLGVGGLVVGAVGIVLAVVATRRRTAD